MDSTTQATPGATNKRQTLGEPRFYRDGTIYTQSELDLLAWYGTWENGSYTLVPPHALFAFVSRQALNSPDADMAMNGLAWLHAYLRERTGYLYWLVDNKALQPYLSGEPAKAAPIPLGTFARYILACAELHTPLAVARIVKEWMQREAAQALTNAEAA